MEERKAQEMEQEDSAWKQLRRGWCWGEAAFREELLGLIEQERSEHHYGEEIVATVHSGVRGGETREPLESVPG